MVEIRGVGRSFLAGVLCLGLAWALSALRMPGDVIALVGGAILITCSAALVALGVAPASSAVRFAASALLVILLLLPFLVVAVMLVAGADPMATFLVAIMLLPLLFILIVSVVLMLLALTLARALRRRHA